MAGFMNNQLVRIGRKNQFSAHADRLTVKARMQRRVTTFEYLKKKSLGESADKDQVRGAPTTMSPVLQNINKKWYFTDGQKDGRTDRQIIWTDRRTKPRTQG